MTQLPAKTTRQAWHTDDFLVRLAAGEAINPSADGERADNWGDANTATDAGYGVATLSLIAGDPHRQERLAVLRNDAFGERDLVVFGALTTSSWALNALAGRYTGHAHDWASLRAAIIAAAASDRDADPVLSGISLDKLYGLVDLLHERDIDPEAERALIRLVASGVVAGRALHEQHREPLVERLLQLDLADEARAVLPKLSKRTWVRHAVSAELEHPRFGGSYDSMLRLLNEPYHRVGIEPISLGDEADATPFRRITSTAVSTVETGPLVTVIMTTNEPGAELFTAVRSIIAQSYQNWELIITDDASPRGIATTLKQVAALDPRIRVIRNSEAAGVFVRRNEAMPSANGEFITMQDAEGWAHPRRLEIQVRDLVSNPGRLGNVVSAMRVTGELSLVGRPGSKLFPDETSLMFRREEVLKTIGFFDSVNTGAGLEYRRRLERATGISVPTLAPGTPLELILGHDIAPDETQYGINLWNRPDRAFYWSGMRRHHERIEADEATAFVPFPLTERPFAAPSRWTSDAPGTHTFDLVVVLDGREFSKLREFHATVAAELAEAAQSGLSVAVLQSYSLPGPRGRAFFSPMLQDLIDSGTIARVEEGDDVTATVVVVRHAGAAQGHPAERRSVSATRVVIVEESAAKDVRGVSYARPDVTDTVTGWFGVEPTWEQAAPALPAAEVTTVTFGDKRVELSIGTGVPRAVRAVHLRSEDETLTLDASVSGSESVLAVTEAAPLMGKSWIVEVAFDAGAGRTVTQTAPLTLGTVIANDAKNIAIRTDDGALCVLPSTEANELPARSTFARMFLAASATSADVAGENFQVAVSQANATSLSRVYALRQMEPGVVRRRDFTAGSNGDGAKVWERPLSKFADSRWVLCGTFRTPQGLVEFPIRVEADTPVSGTKSWVPEVKPGGKILVAPPRPGRAVRAATRLTETVSSRLGGLTELIARRTKGDGAAPIEKISFDASHGEPRTATPTVSVVMPVYNVEPFLDVAISSVLNQEFADLELILVDDASTDNGRRIIRKYWQADPRVRVFALDHNTIGGAGVPSNIGIRAARGEYVAFADSDDHVTPQGLARMVALAETHETDLVIGDFKTFSEKLPDGTESYDRKVWADLPLNKPISAFEHPALFKLSPVPWRKLYRRTFLQEHAIAYPEGDYFYEDNPLHWFVLSRAHNVVMCEEVISWHRMEREGQTMGAATYKLGAFVNHMNTILNFLAESTDDKRDVLFESFFDYLARTNWVAKDQSQQAAGDMIRHGMNDIYQRARAAAPGASVAPNLRARLASYGSSYPEVDLTVVIPVYNSADLLRQTVDSVLALTGLKYNVILVDDGSTDASLTIMEEYESAHDNVHVFAQGNRGAGRARNSVIPLSTGRYTFFLDADDVIDPEALTAAVAQADADSADLLFVEYKIELTDEARTDGMPKADRDVWRKLRTATRHPQRQQLVAQLINYPWNRIIRTSLLHDANIFFGATVVHNDVQFHWHSIVSAQNISFLDVAVTTHRKFATREQVTNIQDARRMAVLEALRSTHERIALLDAYPNVRSEWEKFATHLLGWAKSRVPESLHENYETRRQELLRAFTTN